MADPQVQQDEARAAREALAQQIQGEGQALLDAFEGELLKALATAIKPIMDAYAKARSQALQLPQYVAKFEGLKATIRQQEADLKARDATIDQYEAQTLEGRIRTAEAQKSALEKFLASAKAPPPAPPEDKPADAPPEA